MEGIALIIVSIGIAIFLILKGAQLVLKQIQEDDI